MRKKYISPELLMEDLRIDGNLLTEVSWSYITPDPGHDYDGDQFGGNGAKGTTPGSLWEDESEEDAPKKDHF